MIIDITIMGIPSYFSYIVKNHSNIIRKLSSNTIHVDNLYLDCNSIIYDIVHNIDFTKVNKENETLEILNAICDKIDSYIFELKPSNIIYIAFDGVAPVAKLEQQRGRRYKSVYQNMITKAIHKSSGPDPWNTTAITPGTIFMQKLNEKIETYYNDCTKFGSSSLIVSTSKHAGEGEHKLFELIRECPEAHVDKNTIIYGLDADLIMLSINHLPIAPNIYLFRETPEFIKSINVELEPNESYILDIPELAKTITLDMNNGNDLKVNRVYDYIFLCFFLGNDFMPHLPAVNIRTGGVDKMLQAYKATIGNTKDILTDGKTIHWKNVRRLVQFLADSEEEFLKQETKQRDRKEKYPLPNITPEDQLNQFISIPLYDRSIEKKVNPFKPNWQERYYDNLFNMTANEANIRAVCHNYLEALEWTMKYYTVGCPDWRWCYNYGYPPLLSDLIHHIPITNHEFVMCKPERPVSELVQLCYVLPKQSLQYLPPNLYKKLLQNHSKWYSTDCTFMWAYCRYFWEAHVNLPHIDINELEEFVNKNK
jgi:5'-3' exonuclease